MKRFTLLILLILTIIFSPILIKDIKSQKNYVKVFESGNDFKLYYYLEGNIVYFKMEGKTTGYVAIGFEPTDGMKDADMIIGYVKDGKLSIIDAYSTGVTGPHYEDTNLGGKNDILSSFGSESNGITTIEFSRYLDTNDKYDKVLKIDKNIKIIWAISNSDDFKTKHSKRGSGTIVLKKIDEATQPTVKKTVLRLIIGSDVMYINDSSKKIDVPPQIIEGRTLLPIRWVAEPLGATVGWDPNEKKVTVSLKEIQIELWIGKNIARVNGVDTPIDPNNPKVVPMIINGRTMLPVRFVAENLGCEVNWDPVKKEVQIVYPK